MEREWPSGYLEACKKHPAFDKDSVEAIWDQLKFWRESGHLLPTISERAEREGHAGVAEKVQAQLKSIDDFQVRILKAVFEGDESYLANLSKAVKSSERPASVQHGIRAATEAFWELFVEQGLVSRDDWPTKQEVRRRAEEIMNKNGLSLPSERHWPRIYQQAGLSELLSVKQGSARMRKVRPGSNSAQT
jgi:hypothetical protein